MTVLKYKFHIRLQEGNFGKIEALLRRRNEALFSVDVRDPETGNTAIIWAAKRGHNKVSMCSRTWNMWNEKETLRICSSQVSVGVILILIEFTIHL